ncbi:MAG: 2-oxoacid:acceptor oxidoreductase family protein, partial [Deltaproteobacteria bacterium]|nr:2-oxoacid:acceptor oxidoreductase family protein [Deltaproteobacteria bacterium]
MEIINDFTIRVATVNGSGSQSANNILLKALFYMGLPVAGKNIFPSNIAGLPTWYNIRVSKEGYIGNQTHAQVLVLMNPETFEEDLKEAKPGAAVIYQDKLGEGKTLRDDLIYYPCPFQKLVNECCEAAKLRKMVINMIYVGVAAQLLNIEEA